MMLLGLAGAFLPLVPGVPLVWLGAVGYGVLDGFRHLSIPAFLVLTALGAIGTTAELWATQIGARAGGASADCPGRVVPLDRTRGFPFCNDRPRPGCTTPAQV